MNQLALDLPHRTAFGGADFLVSPSNQEAVAWLDRWPQWPGPALALVGPPGCGKTHLAHVFQARAGAVLLAPAAIATARLPDVLGAARAAVLDDSETAAAEPLLHLYNLLAERRGHLVVLAREPPARWSIVLADLRSRLLAAPVATIQPPDDALLVALLVKLFADRQLTISAEVVPYLAARIERSFAAAEAAVAAVDRASLAARRPITVPLVRTVLEG
jgi:chromosomal replication initiation ATPase DnaA